MGASVLDIVQHPKMSCRVPHDPPSHIGAHDDRPEFHALVMPQALRGEIENLLLEGQRLAGARQLRIYVPATELRGSTPLPIVLVNDGHKAFEPANHGSVSPLHQSGTLQMHRVMDGLLCSGAVRPAVVVAIGVHASTRADQYVPIRARLGDIEFGGCGDLYLDLLEHEVLPAVRAFLGHVPLSHAAEDQVLLGSSIGGFSALYGALTRPGVFGAAVALSPSAWIDDGFLTRLAQESPSIVPRIAADIGHHEQPPIRKHCRALFEVLTQRGGDRVHALDVDGAHNEDSWRARLPRMLRHVLTSN
ncbi:Enterochelin esterase [Planctomycetes bacterium Poly30]|uniref:Enterochelin esterase n=1 Tax=Saltatorellus ferox TaxID=2528018 RepID=A0A518EW18_9BACT|nr:Enterochelin esterase [Planctomycetes bacterium Poly30]